jgi:predicted DNA-binding transcriptional regulator
MSIYEPLDDDEKEILQILIIHHKSILFSDDEWIINMTVEGEYVCHIVLDHTIVTGLRKKGLIQRELCTNGTAHYVLTHKNNYQDILAEMRVQKALGVDISTLSKNFTSKSGKIKIIGKVKK